MIDYAAEVAASRARHAAKIAEAAAEFQIYVARTKERVGTVETRKIATQKRKRNLRQARYRDNHHEEILAKAKEYYPVRVANGKARKDAEWRKNNRAQMKQRQKEWRDKHREALRQKDRDRYHRDHPNAKRRKHGSAD